MTRVQLFKKLLKCNGYTVKTIAPLLNTNYETFRKRVALMKFSTTEQLILKRLLNLTDSQYVQLFLPNESEVENMPKREKVVLVKESNPKTLRPVMIDVDLLDQLKELKFETGISVQHIVEEFIKFGFEHVEILEQEELL